MEMSKTIEMFFKINSNYYHIHGDIILKHIHNNSRIRISINDENAPMAIV